MAATKVERRVEAAVRCRSTCDGSHRGTPAGVPTNTFVGFAFGLWVFTTLSLIAANRSPDSAPRTQAAERQLIP
jgi:hypothetical protein